MDCIATQSALDLYVDGELDFVARKTVEEHLQGCASCALELAALRRLTMRTHDALPELVAPPEMDRAILRAIAAGPTNKGKAARVPNHPVGYRPVSLHHFFEDVARAFGIVGEWFRDNGRWRF